MYADTDFWIALFKDDDWLGDRARAILEEHDGDLRVSIVTFVELFLVEERFAFDRERAITSILELADFEGSEDVLYQASAYVDEGLDTFDAFHAAIAGETIVSSDGDYEDLPVERRPLEPPGE